MKVRKGFLRERWRFPSPIDAEQLLVQPSSDTALRDEVRERREPAAPGRQQAYVTDRAHAERRAVAAPVVGEELALEARDVDADRTLRLACAALEAEIEHLVDAFIAEAR